MSSEPLKRAFIVGFPRSGTTVVQSILATHPRCISFPESHFFDYLYIQRPILRYLPLASPHARRGVIEFLRNAKRTDLIPTVPRFGAPHTYAAFFASALDRIALDGGAHAWLEKTPNHVLYLRQIERIFHKPVVIHVLRHGEDAVASYYEATQTYPNAWGGARSLDSCIDRWIREVSLSLQASYRPNHYLVQYSDVLQDPLDSLAEVAKALDLSPAGFKLSRVASAAQGLVTSMEPWKERNVSSFSVTSASSRKFETCLTRREQGLVRARLRQSRLPEYLARPHDRP